MDWEGLDRSYRLHEDIYRRIYTRCGLKFVAVEASSGAMGGSQSQEFMVRMEAGEDFVVTCECGYAANLERAVSRLPVISDPPADGEPREVHTPSQKTIAEIADFLKVPPSHQIKSLVYVVNDQPQLFLVRGDHQLNEAKVMATLKSMQVRPARPEEISQVFGAGAGSLGPVGRHPGSGLRRPRASRPSEPHLRRQQERLSPAGSNPGRSLQAPVGGSSLG